MASIILPRPTIVRSIGVAAFLGVAVLAACSNDTGEFVGAPARITAVGGTDLNGQVGDTLGPFAVKVTDTAGTPVAGVAVNFSIVGNATLVTTSATTDQDGGTFTSIALGHTVGNMTITASVSGIATPAIFNTHSYAGAPVTMVITGGANQSAPRGTALPDMLSVSVTDQYGNGVNNILVSWEATAGVLGTPSSRTTNGAATTTYTLPATPGAQTITASSIISGTTPTIKTFTATGN